ncbi:MAG TPA: hypothetical protein VFX79_01575 [Candidatus Saccharimonadales bacterium]|nr:hypothetical protein [Candidatus Saccharimonadales bacterium]
MVKYLVTRFRPGKGFAHFFHLALIALIPIFIWFFIRLDLVAVAFIVLLLSKWRMFAVHPRHWIAHIRSNAVDVIAGLSFIIFIAQSSSLWAQLLWVVVYEIWLLFIKSGSSTSLVSSQAIIAQTLGVVSFFLAFKGADLAVYVIGFWLITYFSARHFFAIFDELHGSLIASIWAFFAASIMWVLGHWLIFFGPIAQPALLLTVLSFCLGGLYYLEKHRKLHTTIKRQLIAMMLAIVFVIVVFSDWGDKAV